MDMREMEQAEVFVPLAVMPKYEISQSGVVRNIRRGTVREHLVTEYGTKHLKLHQWDDRTGSYRNFYVGIAEAVAVAFLGPAPEGTTLYHRDGDRGNVHVANLYYGPPGSAGARAKLKAQNRQHSLDQITPDIVAAVEAQIAGKKYTVKLVKALAAEYGLSKHVMVGYFVRGWRSEAQLAARKAS